MNEITEKEWQKAVEHLCRSRKRYVDVQGPGREEAEEAIKTHYKPLTDRWHSGERSRELYNAMLALPVRN